MPTLEIDAERCTACGLCGTICPRHVTETIGAKGKKKTIVTKREEICLSCGQCMAICPKGAIQLQGLDPTTLQKTPKVDCSPEQLMTLFQHRRSVRRYKDEPVDRELIDQIVESSYWAPSASSLGQIGVIVIDQPHILRELSGHIYKLFERVEKMLSNPIGSTIMKVKSGRSNVATLQHHVLPGMRWYRQRRDEGAGDEVLRDCPVLMLFHGSVDEPAVEESCYIAAWQAVLMAEVLGLGTCINGMIPPPCNKVTALRKRLQLPQKHEVYAALTLGHPKHKFKKTIRRRLYQARYLE